MVESNYEGLDYCLKCHWVWVKTQWNYWRDLLTNARYIPNKNVQQNYIKNELYKKLATGSYLIEKKSFKILNLNYKNFLKIMI